MGIISAPALALRKHSPRVSSTPDASMTAEDMFSRVCRAGVGHLGRGRDGGGDAGARGDHALAHLHGRNRCAGGGVGGGRRVVEDLRREQLYQTMRCNAAFPASVVCSAWAPGARVCPALTGSCRACLHVLGSAKDMLAPARVLDSTERCTAEQAQCQGIVMTVQPNQPQQAIFCSSFRGSTCVAGQCGSPVTEWASVC